GGLRVGQEKRPIILEDINPLERERIKEVFDCGIRVINAMLTLGKGQKVGIFAGAGVGKSTLLGMIVRNSSADAVVLALIGERGREVKEFIEDVLGDEGRRKSIIVTTTSDQTPILKVKGALSAMVHARYLASKGMNVLLVMDSITRLAMAQREVGLSAGEPPTMKGYTPSVFYLLSKVVENCGNFKKGSITGIFSVLVEGDDITLDPVADSLVGVLDGHIILSRKRANAGLFPAIDPVKSLSRLMPQVVSDEHMKMSMYLRELLSNYESMEDMVNLGLYTPGSNPMVDKVIKHREEINQFFRQRVNDRIDYHQSFESLKTLYQKIV
ncbi:MAG: FliI/YscN family ATPase, partial [Aquificaceae bacterium]|nr:FliI/YscN family ATPase [Aquificaceae bacterium]MDW8434254.1 FliI/YscN family ATPase [Aquificaceae bacterium]